jgi:uncharacterized damage-inducible protein DinB
VAGVTETQREPVPRDDGGELDTALPFLRFARASVLKKCEGLDDEQLRRELVPTGTTLLGLVAHLTDGERYWFAHHVAGEDLEVDFDMRVPSDRSTADVLQGYHDAIAASDAIVTAAGGPDATVAVPVDGRQQTLRWVIAHMTSETARHAGHADIIREQIDGTTGR